MIPTNWEESAPSDQDPREKREMREGEGSKVIRVIKVHLAYKGHKEREVKGDIQGTKVRKERLVIRVNRVRDDLVTCTQGHKG